MELPGSAPRIDVAATRGSGPSSTRPSAAFSGTGVYRPSSRSTRGQASATSLRLELGSVCDIARVVVNGQDCGIAWTPPFRVDVSAAARTGRNSVEIHVATPWRNRLIAEAGAASGEIFEPMTAVYEPTAEPLPAGLGGRVTVLVGV